MGFSSFDRRIRYTSIIGEAKLDISLCCTHNTLVMNILRPQSTEY